MSIGRVDVWRSPLDLLVGAPPEWQEQALCSQSDPEAWFPEKGGSNREAKRVCFRCEVRIECLEYALVHDERFGVWGGMSERERRRMLGKGGPANGPQDVADSDDD